MQAELAQVQKRLWVVLATTIVLGLVMLPRPGNRRLIGSLEELTTFRAGFVQKTAEANLASQAKAQGMTSLATVEAAAKSKKGPKVRAADGAPAIEPLTTVSLATLADVQARGEPGTSLALGTPDAEALAASLVWRFARSADTGVFTLRSVALAAGDVSPEDLALEREVALLRIQSLEARADIEPATRRVETLEQRVEFQSKRRSKQVYKSMTLLQEARTALAEQTKKHADTQALYDQKAEAAQRAKKAQPQLTVPTAALATVTYEVGGASKSVVVPVPISVRQVPVTPLKGASFAETRQAGLWDEVKGLDGDGAIAAVRGHFNWHLRGVKLGSFELLGVHLLQVLPLLLPLVLWFFLVQLRRAATSYNPFTTQVPEQTPQIGLKSRFLELWVLLLLPLLAVGCAIASIALVHRVPILPVVAGVGVFGLGGYAFTELRELREQTQRIVHTHSLMPPQPSR